MQTMELVLTPIIPDCYLAINDLKYANYLVPMPSDYRKYLKLSRKGNCLNA